MNMPITVGVDDVADDTFVIDSPEAAAWAVSVIRARRRHLADLEEQHAVRMAKAARELEAAERRYMPELRAWAAVELKRQGARAPRHVDVDTGRLQFTHREGGVQITDDKAIMAFAESLPGGIRDHVEKRIDRERVRLGLGVLFTQKMTEKLAEVSASSTPPDGFTAFEMAKAHAIAAMPAGAAFVDDHDDFRIVSGGDR